MKEIDEIKNDIAEIASHLAQMGWSEANAGNISVLLSRELSFEESANPKSYTLLEPVKQLAGRTILVTASGSRFRRMKRDIDTQIIPITISQYGTTATWPAEYPNPTSEIATHLLVHSLSPEANWNGSAIVHTHSTKMLALSSCDMPGEMLKEAVKRAHPEITTLMKKGLSFLDFAPPGTWELGEKTKNEFKRADAVIWRKHGILGYADNIEMACDFVEMVEKAAEILILEQGSFGQFLGLKNKELESLQKLTQNNNVF